MSINFCHIVPVPYLNYIKNNKTHLLLAHLIEDNEQYRNFYRNLKEEDPTVFYHMDNSAFEMFKRGTEMYPSDKLIEMGHLVKADSIVLSDYPKQHWMKTVSRAVELIPEFKREGFKTFFCPQSELGKLDDLMKGFEWAINYPYIDYIGVSILACPIAFGVNEQTFGDTGRSESYRLQRYLSRWATFEELDARGLLGEKTLNRFHCLGMTDGPREISLLHNYHKHIFSWDSSAAMWHAINGIAFDQSPTGLVNGKFEEEVDFSHPLDESLDTDVLIKYNMNLIDTMCKGDSYEL